jgi:hypothetical protein
MPRERPSSEAAEEQGHAPKATIPGRSRPLASAREGWTEHTAEQRAKVKSMLREIVRKLTITEQTAGLSEPLLEAVTFHARRLRARGVEAQAAQRQAESLVQDPAHRATCDMCKEEVPF